MIQKNDRMSSCFLKPHKSASSSESVSLALTKTRYSLTHLSANGTKMRAYAIDGAIRIKTHICGDGWKVVDKAATRTRHTPSWIKTQSIGSDLLTMRRLNCVKYSTMTRRASNSATDAKMLTTVPSTVPHDMCDPSSETHSVRLLLGHFGGEHS